MFLLSDNNDTNGLSLSEIRMPHLLGDDWSGTRWYASAQERDVAMAGILKQPNNYRKGDKPSIRVTAIDPE